MNKTAETKKIRAAVVIRANESCERCGIWVGNDGELDHFFGRAKGRQAVSNCVYLCHQHHRDKTDSKPSAKDWLVWFSVHCVHYQYGPEGERAQAKLDVLKAKRMAS